MRDIRMVAALVLAVVLVFTAACAKLDVVGQQSVNAFDEVLKAASDRVSADEQNAGWSLTAPDGSARFVWSAELGKGTLYDVLLAVDATPFIDAGLDTSRLPKNYTVEGDSILVGIWLGDDVETPTEGETPLASYRQIVDKHASVIGYHSAMDHYNVDLGDGNLFEWAKDLSVNTVDNSNQDKDIVFVLNPEPLIAAGVDPQKVEGWVYATVNMGMGAKPEQVYKLLKPFDLK